jgi:membrane protease YdiL (CAAX protease family)
MLWLLVSSAILFYAWIHFVVILPSIAKKYRKEHPAGQTSIPLVKIYKSMSVPTASLAWLALLLGFLNHVQIFGSIEFDFGTMFLALGVLALMMLLEQLEWKCTSPQKRRKLLQMVPRNRQERLLCVLFMWVPAIGEEIFYRAVLFGFLFRLTGSNLTAAFISAVLFAVAHRSYGLQAVISSFLIGLVLQYFVYVSGGLYLSIAFHYIINVLNGFVIGSRKTGDALSESPSREDERMAVPKPSDM